MTKRKINLDIIRIFALLSVMSVHFFLHSGFYKDIINGPKDFILVTFREFFMICVPLFMILTGYLNNKKELSKDYYKSIIPKLLIYVICAILQVLVMKYYEHKNINIFGAITTITNFKIHYGWYMNMYVGLFLIIPFLNLIYNNIKTKKDKQMLLIIFLILTCLPSLFYKTQLFFSDFFVVMYPITYYFIGCYIKEYGLNINIKKNVILLVSLLLIYAIVNYYFSFDKAFLKTSFNHDWGAIMPLTLSVLVFNLLLNIKGESNKFISKISELTFGAYLVEWILDRITYDYLNSHIAYENRIYFFILCVLFVFICSIILSYIVNFIVNSIMKINKKK